MSGKSTRKPLAFVLGTAMTATLSGANAADAGESPFSMTPLPGGYLLLAEGKCGEGRCGAQMATAGKGGEGRCGLRQMDADGDGKVTREEFMQGHEEMFSVIDANGDGVIDAAEGDAHMAGKAGCRMEGKCGEGKCGGAR